jgi:hypothetical protein
MGRSFEAWQRELIQHMIHSRKYILLPKLLMRLNAVDVLSKLSVLKYVFGRGNPPLNHGGRPRSVTPPMLQAVLDHLIEKPGLYLEEMAAFLYDELGISVSPSSIQRALLCQ